MVSEFVNSNLLIFKGVAKKMHYFGNLIDLKQNIEDSCNNMTQAGQSEIIRENGDTLGCILLTSNIHKSQPLFVSQGHKISLSTAVSIVAGCVGYHR